MNAIFPQLTLNPAAQGGAKAPGTGTGAGTGAKSGTGPGTGSGNASGTQPVQSVTANLFSLLANGTGLLTAGEAETDQKKEEQATARSNENWQRYYATREENAAIVQAGAGAGAGAGTGPAAKTGRNGARIRLATPPANGRKQA